MRNAIGMRSEGAKTPNIRWWSPTVDVHRPWNGISYSEECAVIDTYFLKLSAEENPPEKQDSSIMYGGSLVGYVCLRNSHCIINTSGTVSEADFKSAISLEKMLIGLEHWGYMSVYLE